MRTFTLLILVLFLFVGCSKTNPGRYRIELIEATNVSYSDVTLKIAHKFPRGVYNVQKKVYIGTDPTGDNPLVFDYNLTNASNGKFVEESHEVSNLFGGTTYYVKMVLESSLHDVVSESEIVSFTTIDLPNAPCELTDNFVDLDGSPQTMSPLTFQNPNALGYYSMHTNHQIGDLDFWFKEEPQTGIYRAIQNLTDFVGTSDEKLVKAGGTFDIGWNCYHQAMNFQYFYVHNNNGVISIEFCDIPYSPQGPNCTQVRMLTGKVSM